MHASQIYAMTYKTNFNLTINSFFENSKSTVFYLRKKLFQKNFQIYIQ